MWKDRGEVKASFEHGAQGTGWISDSWISGLGPRIAKCHQGDLLSSCRFDLWDSMLDSPFLEELLN